MLRSDQIRFSLAYYNRTSPVPMVSIVVGDCDSEIDLLTLNTLYCEPVTITAADSITTIKNVTSTPVLATHGLITSNDIDSSVAISDATTSTSTTASTVTMTTESISTTQESTNQNASSVTNDNIKIISGVVVIFLILIILLISLVVLTFMIKRRRKSASMNVIDPIEMSTQPQMLHNTASKSNNFDNKNYFYLCC